jgi:hypothetical protein
MNNSSTYQRSTCESFMSASFIPTPQQVNASNAASAALRQQGAEVRPVPFDWRAQGCAAPDAFNGHPVARFAHKRAAILAEDAEWLHQLADDAHSVDAYALAKHLSDLAAIIDSAAAAPYERGTYELRRYELVAPKVRNDGETSHYPERIRAELERAGFTGWTELDTFGHWNGGMEPGTTFVIYAADWRSVPAAFDAGATLSESPVFGADTGEAWVSREVRTEVLLAELGRSVMTDQDAVQVVRAAHADTLIEA